MSLFAALSVADCPPRWRQFGSLGDGVQSDTGHLSGLCASGRATEAWIAH